MCYQLWIANYEGWIMENLKKAETESDLGMKIKGSKEAGHQVVLKHGDAIKAIFNTKHQEQAEALLGHCFNALARNEASEDHPGNDQRLFMASIVADVKPRDPVERMLAVQMAATHVALIRSSRWLANAETIPQVQAHYSGFNKLARTYAAQVEALRKHRNGGAQTVRVEHVTVEAGAQAVVGNVQTGGRGND
jgi:hypothetical protein